jgi:hypothetical protein
MTETTSSRPRWAIVAALVAVAFGIFTVFVGGRTLFGGPVERAAAGNIVPFVLWFNFLAASPAAVCFYGNVGLRNCRRRSRPPRLPCSLPWESIFFSVVRLKQERSVG